MCPCDYSCCKTWIDSSILIILTNKIYISETKKLTLGHGHGQGKVKYVIIQKFVLTINHERMIGFWWYLDIWLIFMRQKSWPKVKITRSKVKVISAISQKIVLAINRKRVTGFWRYLYIWLTSMRNYAQWSYNAKVASSRVWSTAL